MCAGFAERFTLHHNIFIGGISREIIHETRQA
jgi:hypothetical protein